MAHARRRRRRRLVARRQRVGLDVEDLFLEGADGGAQFDGHQLALLDGDDGRVVAGALQLVAQRVHDELERVGYGAAALQHLGHVVVIDGRLPDVLAAERHRGGAAAHRRRTT